MSVQKEELEALIYWRDMKISGVVFGSTMVTLLCLTQFSLVSVVSNLALLVLIGAFVFRIYKGVLQVVQKTPNTHPLQEYLQKDITLPEDKAHQFVESIGPLINAFIGELRRLFLVEDFFDSFKLLVVLWLMTYIGSWFNGLTLVIMGVVLLFTVPKLYESNREQVDAVWAIIQEKMGDVQTKIMTAVPTPLKKLMGNKTE